MVNISMQMMKNECKKQETCNKKCAFYDPDTPNRCLIYANPCDWELDEIAKAFEDMINRDEAVRYEERGGKI